MELMTQMLVPCVLAGTALYGTLRRVDVYGALVRGAGQGLETLARILPALVCLLTAVSMVRSSGLLEALAGCLAPVLGRLGLPSELLPLMLVRPISGSAALGVGEMCIRDRPWPPPASPPGGSPLRAFWP